MTLPAWRPLKDAPFEGTILVRLTSGEVARATAAVVHVGRDYDGSGGWQEAAWVNEDTGQVIRDDDLVGWRPEACILHTGQACACAACLADQWGLAPIADTLELDRAVQLEIVRAFAGLLDTLVDDERMRLDAAKQGTPEDCFQLFGRHTLRRFARILHTSMGGRIPDEVPK